jgi:isoleucyl-tRNA synthetase
VSTVYYCWVCETPLSDNAVSDTHYESNRVIFFCSSRHRSEYQALKQL